MPASARTSPPAPQLATLRSLVDAGGGAEQFKTTEFMAALDRARADAEFAELVKRYGAARVKQFATVLDFVIGDAVRRLHARGVVLPSVPDDEKTDGRGLAAALETAGKVSADGTFSTDAMFDRLITPHIRGAVYRDAEAAFGNRALTTLRMLLADSIGDLAAP